MRGLSDEYGSWKIICISRRSGFNAPVRRCVMSSPSKRIVPLVGSSSRMIRRAVVVLPQPVSPTMPERLAAQHVEGDAVDGVHRADLALEDDPAREREVLDEVADLDQRLAHAGSSELDRGTRGLRVEPRLELAPDAPARVAVEQAGDPVRGIVRDRLERGLDAPVRARARTGSADGTSSRSGG